MKRTAGRRLALTIVVALVLLWGMRLAVNQFRRYADARRVANDMETLIRELRHNGVSGPRMGIHDRNTAPAATPNGRPELSIEAQLATERLRNRTAADLTDYGVSAVAASYVEQGQHAHALSLLEPARRSAPASVPLAATLTAALYRRGQPGDRARAFDNALDAIESHPTDPLLLYNVAITADSLLPSGAVSTAWQHYRDAERDPAWLRYASEHVRRRIDASKSRRPDAMRTELLDVTLPAWADACIAASDDERGHRARAQELVSAGGVNEDRFFRDVLTYIAPSSAERCDTRTANAVGELAKARTLYAQDDLNNARPIFHRVATGAARITPLALQARLFVATADYFGDRSRRQSAVKEFDAVATASAHRGYLELLGRAHWMRGYVREDQSDYEGALGAYQSSLEAYTRAASVDGMASGNNLIAGVLDRLGQYEKAWRHRESALAALADMTDSRARSTILTGSIRAASRDGLHRAALQLMTAKLAEEGVLKSPVRLAQALIEKCELQIAASRLEDARKSVGLARAAVDALGAGATRDRLVAQLSIAEAASEPDPVRSRALLSAALSSYRDSGSDVMVARLLLVRARAALRAGDRTAAEIDLRNGIAVVEHARSTLHRNDLRLTYFDDVWDLFDELLELTAARGALDEVLAIAERARGRALSDARHALDTAGRYVAPREGVLVYYLALRSQLIAWVFGDGTPSTIVRTISRDELSSSVRAFSACMADAKSATCDGGPLAELLLVPVLQRSSGATMITIVPDPILQPLPFAALRNPSTNRLLVEDMAVAMTPSLRSIALAGRRGPEPDRALVIGNPIPTELPPLPNAANEASRVASLYDDPMLHTGVNASRAVFLKDLPRADVVHFAGHAVADPELPDFSRLLMAPGAEERGNVYAHELERTLLPRAPVVVLAACETAVGRTSRSEGMISLARAFMSAGARDVIATLWRIDDSVSVPLFVRLHQELRRGESAAHALRSAQLEMVKSTDPARRTPAAWASTVAWVSLGGN